MKQQQGSGTLEPTITAIGLVASFITAISPIFNNTAITQYFTNQLYVVPASFVAVLLGVMVAWNIIQNYQYINIPLPSRQPGGRSIQEKQLIWILALIALAAGLIFSLLNL